MVVNPFHFLDTGHINAHGALRLANAVKREDHVIGSEVRAVMELHIFAQIEAHGGGVDVGPAGGQ